MNIEIVLGEQENMRTVLALLLTVMAGVSGTAVVCEVAADAILPPKYTPPPYDLKERVKEEVEAWKEWQKKRGIKWSGTLNPQILERNRANIFRLAKMLDCIGFSYFWNANQFAPNNVVTLKAIHP
jgi:hypothetical protein